MTRRENDDVFMVADILAGSAKTAHELGGDPLAGRGGGSLGPALTKLIVAGRCTSFAKFRRSSHHARFSETQVCNTNYKIRKFR